MPSDDDMRWVQTIFEQDIAPTLFADSAAGKDEPVLVLLVSQPGAGMAAARAAAQRLWPGTHLTEITPVDLQAYHPDWLNRRPRQPVDVAEAVRPITDHWMAAAVDTGFRLRRSMLVELAPRRHLIDTAERGAQSGYTVHVVVTAQPSPVSRLRAVTEFYLQEVVLHQPGRWVPTANHDAAYSAAPMITAAAQVSPAVSRITVLDQDAAVRYDAHRTNGAWPDDAGSVPVLLHERSRSPDPARGQAWLAAHQQCLAWSSQQGHTDATRRAFAQLAIDATYTFTAISHPGAVAPPTPTRGPDHDNRPRR